MAKDDMKDSYSKARGAMGYGKKDKPMVEQMMKGKKAKKAKKG